MPWSIPAELSARFDSVSSGKGLSGTRSGPPHCGQRPLRPGVAPGARTRKPQPHTRIGTFIKDSARGAAKSPRDPPVAPFSSAHDNRKWNRLSVQARSSSVPTSSYSVLPDSFRNQIGWTRKPRGQRRGAGRSRVGEFFSRSRYQAIAPATTECAPWIWSCGPAGVFSSPAAWRPSPGPAACHP